MLHALCVIAFAVLFSSGPVRLGRIFVKFSGFVVLVICHVGSLSSAPSAQQHAGLQPVPNVTEWCDEDLQKVPSKSWYRDRHPFTSAESSGTQVLTCFFASQFGGLVVVQMPMNVIRQQQPCAVCDGTPSNYVEMISGHVRQLASRLGVPKRNSFWATVVTSFEHYWSPPRSGTVRPIRSSWAALRLPNS
jgi:hypothetical protein